MIQVISMSEANDGEREARTYLDRLRDSRDSSAVLKLRLAALRAAIPDHPILALEGDDDKIVFCRWIGRLRPGLRYEPFLCKGKRGVRQLKNSLARDLGGLDANVYFFVDRDFDDLLGFADESHVFMTDMYSVENYLVLPEVLEAVLRDDFPCHEHPELRERIRQIYAERLNEFLQATREFNRRLFIARRVGIPLAKDLPTRINALASVTLMKVEEIATPVDEVVVYTAQPAESDGEKLSQEFAGLEGVARYRGKNLLLFFKSWLEHLCREYEEPEHAIFTGVDSTTKVRRSEFVLGSFAARSPMPEGLQEFVAAIAA